MKVPSMVFLAALVSLAAAAAPASAQAGSGQAAPTASDGAVEAPGPVRTEIEIGAQGLTARYRFSAPVDSLRLAAPVSEAVDRVRLDDEPGRFAGGIAHCGPDCRFSEAELTRFAPAVRGYPDLIDAGECGYWADVSAYAPADPQTGAPLDGVLAVAGREIALSGEHPQYEAVRAPVRAPVCADVTVMAEDRLAASSARMAADYGAIFGPLPRPPQVIAAPAGSLGPGVDGVRGAAAGDGLIFLFADPEDAPSVEAALAVLSHEMAHLWIGRRARLHPQFDQAWITEGAAEYLSLKQLLRTDMAGDTFVLDRMSRHVSACLSVIGEARLLLNGSTQTGAFPYNCGATIALFADRAAQAAGSSFEAAMADMVADPVFRSGRASGLDYAARLDGHMGPDAGRTLRDSLLAPTAGKRARLLAALNEAGLGVEAERGAAAPDYLASVAARHVLTGLCPEGGGRFRIDSGVVLELGQACHGPAGTSELTAIAGEDPLESPQAALDALAAACGPGGPQDESLTVRLGAETHELECDQPLPDYFRGFALDEARTLVVLTTGP